MSSGLVWPVVKNVAITYNTNKYTLSHTGAPGLPQRDSGWEVGVEGCLQGFTV